MTDDLIGKIVNGYEIIDVIGRGGMATVYRAHQMSMKRDVAIKVLPEKYINDDTYIQRFNQEVAIVAKLEHRNIVPVHDYGEFNGQPYIVMRYMSGGSVDDLLTKGALKPDTILDVLEQIAPALDFAHARQVLHRDIKPSNVLLDDDGGAYLTDFGIARVLSEQQSSGITTQGVVGTPSYMSPEQAQGLSLDARSDIYALGVMLFELTTGRRPFESDTPYGIAVMQVTTPPPSPRSFNPEISFAIEQVIYKALAKNREDRYANAQTLAEALKRALNRQTSVLHDTQPRAVQAAPVVAAPVQPMPVQEQVVYAPPMTPNPGTSGYVPPYAPPRKRRGGGSVWMSAALGGLLGCGVLAVLAVIAIVVVSNLLSNQNVTPVPTVVRTRPAISATTSPTGGTPFATLDPTSAAARDTAVPQASDAQTIVPVGVRPPEGIEAVIGPLQGGIVYFADRNNNYDIYALDFLTGVETQLTFSPQTDSYLSVSPDGQWIAFQSNRDEDFDIYVMDINGENLRQLTQNTVLDRKPAWSPDGEWIIFSSNTESNTDIFNLYRIRPDGSDLELIFENGQRNTDPVYSPDGRYIAFTTGGMGGVGSREIALLELASGSVTLVTSNNFRDETPAFSADGTRLAYLTAGTADDDNQDRATLVEGDLAGNNPQTLWEGLRFGWGPTYSADGVAMAFTAAGDDPRVADVFILSLGDGEVVQVTDGGGQGPSWTPG
jgi:Tol biopolymer transport system component/tRNA A-37 threonylcarbamoyl transferase component Bud32